MLYYADKIHSMHEVRGRDGVGATMDSMELERERGITIVSATTNVDWNGHSVNIVDTPGHVDFTIEVERALSVLDGAILVLCSVGGVQSQSITVDRQLRRHRVPRLAFINKCDRTGANPERVTRQLREMLGMNAVPVQLPIGLEQEFSGVVDLVGMKAIYFDGDNGQSVRTEEIPEELVETANSERDRLLDAISMYHDELSEAWLEGKETEKLIRQAIREGVLSSELTPVFLGSAYRNTGIQPLMDAVVDYLPSPHDVTNTGVDLDNDEKETAIECDPDMPAVALAFKLEIGRFGQLTHVRIYQGTLRKGDEITNVRTDRRVRIGRLVRMHADSMEDIPEATCGDVVALFGVDCASGDTFCGDGIRLSMSPIHVPQPVISLAITPTDRQSSDRLSKALSRFTREDPTFLTYVDPESNDTIIRGMGELHLEVYLERIRREYGVELTAGAPQVAYRETITRRVDFDYTHKKQTGGAGQFARVAGTLEPSSESEYEFVDDIKGGAIPAEYIPACDNGFRDCLKKGSLIGFPIVDVKVSINDGKHHQVDSSEIAFMKAAIGAFREAYGKAGAVILEPIMKVVVEGPGEYQGSVLAGLNQRRGIIVATSEEDVVATVKAEVPLAEMFGYSTALRSLTRGRSEFTMEFAKYSQVPKSIAEALVSEQQEKRK